MDQLKLDPPWLGADFWLGTALAAGDAMVDPSGPDQAGRAEQAESEVPPAAVGSVSGHCVEGNDGPRAGDGSRTRVSCLEGRGTGRCATPTTRGSLAVRRRIGDTRRWLGVLKFCPSCHISRRVMPGDGSGPGREVPRPSRLGGTV